jgi:hypothetical protein
MDIDSAQNDGGSDSHRRASNAVGRVSTPVQCFGDDIIDIEESNPLMLPKPAAARNEEALSGVVALMPPQRAVLADSREPAFEIPVPVMNSLPSPWNGTAPGTMHLQSVSHVIILCPLSLLSMRNNKISSR